MSESAPSSAVLESIVLNNYGILVVITVVVYDYILTIPREIRYIWNTHWTWVSTLYILSRYLGIFLALSNALTNSSFLPDPTKVNDHFQGTGLYMVSIWVNPLFFAASGLVMILRIYAMWNRSKIIIGVLLCAYFPVVITAAIVAGAYGSASYTTADDAAVYILNFSLCVYSLDSRSSLQVGLISLCRISSGILFLILAVLQTLRQSIHMYKATRQWQPNKYMRLFVKDAMIFFVLGLLAFITSPSPFTMNISMIFPQCLGYLYYGPFIPHLVISVRELYARELRGHAQVDTGFGIFSHSPSSGNAAVSTIAFAEATPQQDLGTQGDVEGFGLVVDDTYQV